MTSSLQIHFAHSSLEVCCMLLPKHEFVLHGQLLNLFICLLPNPCALRPSVFMALNKERMNKYDASGSESSSKTLE